MPFGRGFGFRGGFPPWPYVGRGRGGLPRCWAYGGYGEYGFDPYLYGAPPYGWEGPYGMGYPPHDQMYPGYPYTPHPWESPYASPMMTAEEEMEWLKNQAGSIRQEIDQIKNRISELGKE
jgi:hypothetical protein